MCLGERGLAMITLKPPSATPSWLLYDQAWVSPYMSQLDRASAHVVSSESPSRTSYHNRPLDMRNSFPRPINVCVNEHGGERLEGRFDRMLDKHGVSASLVSYARGSRGISILHQYGSTHAQRVGKA